MENSVLVDSGDYFAHGFRFDPISQELDRVVIHDQKGMNERGYGFAVGHLNFLTVFSVSGTLIRERLTGTSGLLIWRMPFFLLAPVFLLDSVLMEQAPDKELILKTMGATKDKCGNLLVTPFKSASDLPTQSPGISQ